MSIDLSEFHDIFFEECFEGLEVMETGLLNLDKGLDGSIDVEEINAIFRAAHSIKGGGASFGFDDISKFTHVMETLLDEMRDGRRPVARLAVDLLLESVDCLQEMVNAARDGKDCDQQRTTEVNQRLLDMLATDGDQQIETTTADTEPESTPATADITPSAVATDSTTDSTQADAETTTTCANPEPEKRNESGSSKESSSIRVSIDKIDGLINMVGELVITQSMLSQIGEHFQEHDSTDLENLRDGLAQLERNTRELQESVLQVRMLPISFSFSRFPRLVRDLGGKMNKLIDLKIYGENTEVDKTVLEKIGDPLVHLVRNSLDHGLETPEIRKAAGKPETGTLELSARHEGGNIVIEVIDDGAGINKDVIRSKAIEKGLINETEELSDERIYNLIFEPGFSTATTVSDVSGRGVGMDVVRRNIRDLGGNVSLNSQPGLGSKVTIRLPLTLAILDGQLVNIGKETYIVPLISIVESLQTIPEHVNSITGQAEFYRLRDKYIPIIRLNSLFAMKSGITDLCEGLLVVVESDGQQVGLFVDDLMGQQQVVIKSLKTNFRQVQGISGATILGDGTVALIMDVPGIIQRHQEQCSSQAVSVPTLA